MKVSVGPLQVTAGQFALTMPASRDLVAGILLFNNSQYLLSVGMNGLWIQPFSGAWIAAADCNPSSLVITAQQFGQQLDAAAGQVLTGTWFTSDEAVPDVPSFSADPVTVATALAAAGIPSVYTNTQLYSGILTAQATGAGAIQELLIAPYASLTIKSNNDPFMTNPMTALRLDFFSASVLPPGDQLAYTEYLTTPDQIYVAGGPTGIAWSVPVNAGALRITNMTNDSSRIVVNASNRSAGDRIRTLTGTVQPRRLGANAAYTAGSRVNLTASDGFGDKTTYTGRIWVRCANASVGGRLGYTYGRGDGTVQTFYVSSAIAAGTDYVGELAHPAVPVRWVYLPATTNTAASAVSFDITPF